MIASYRHPQRASHLAQEQVLLVALAWEVRTFLEVPAALLSAYRKTTGDTAVERSAPSSWPEIPAADAFSSS